MSQKYREVYSSNTISLKMSNNIHVLHKRQIQNKKYENIIYKKRVELRKLYKLVKQKNIKIREFEDNIIQNNKIIESTINNKNHNIEMYINNPLFEYSRSRFDNKILKFKEDNCKLENTKMDLLDEINNIVAFIKNLEVEIKTFNNKLSISNLLLGNKKESKKYTRKNINNHI